MNAYSAGSKPATVHWGIPDPAAVDGDGETMRTAFRKAWTQLEKRIRLFLELTIGKLDDLELKEALTAIGRFRD